MATDLISKKTRTEFQEHLVGSTLREITALFDAADLLPKEGHVCQAPGQRRGLVEQYYANINFASWRDVNRLLMVYEMVLVELSTPTQYLGGSPEHRRMVSEGLLKWLQRDGFEFANGKLTHKGHVPQLEELAVVAQTFDAVVLREQLSRLAGTVDADPRLAIGTAKELIETTCKTILRDRSVACEASWNVTQLVKATRVALRLTDDDIPGDAPASETVKRILSNLANVAQGVAELRNDYGTGHGSEARARGLGPRHARLAVGSATTLCTFLFQTHEDRPHHAAKEPTPLRGRARQ